MGDGQTLSQDDLDSLFDQANGSAASADEAAANSDADAPSGQDDTPTEGLNTVTPAEIEELLAAANGAASEANPPTEAAPDADASDTQPVIQKDLTDTAERQDVDPTLDVKVDTLEDVPTPQSAPAGALPATEIGSGSPLRAAIASRIQAVVTKLRAAGQSIEGLQHERDEARARLDETLEVNERLSREIRQEQESRQVQDDQVRAIEDELGRLRSECQALAEEGTGREAALSARVQGLEDEKTRVAAELQEAYKTNAELEEQMARLREAHSRMAERSDQIEVALGKMQRNNRELSRALEQAEKVIASAADQQRFSEAVSDAFGEIETSLESLETP